MGLFDDLTQQYGLPPGLLSTFSGIESGGNPSAQTGSYRGLFQLSPSEFNRYGGGNIYDAGDNSRAAAAKLSDETQMFRSSYGRDPTPAELYMIHQQGWGGYQAHTANPDAPAWQNMALTGEGRQKGQDWAKRAIWGNVPDDVKANYPGGVDSLTSRDFMELWRKKVARFSGNPSMADSTDLGSSSLPGSPFTPPDPRDPRYAKLAQAFMGAGNNAPAAQASMPAATPGPDPLTPPDPRYAKLAEAFMQSGISQPVRGWGDALRGLAGIIAGNSYGSMAYDQAKTYNTELGRRIADAANDPKKAIATMATSGNPAYEQAAAQAIIAPKPQVTVTKIGQDQYGADVYGKFHPSTGEITGLDGTPLKPGQPGGPVAVPSAVDASGKMLMGPDYLATLPADRQQMVKNLIEGRIPWPTGAYARSPMAQRTIQDAQRVDPTFNEAANQARAKYLKDETPGGPVGRDITKLNTAIQHTGELYDKIDKLGNIGVPVIGQPLNYLGNLSWVNSGGDVNAFNTAKDQVMHEWTSYFAGSGHAADADVQRQLDLLSSSRSPEQLKAAVRELIKLGKGKLDTMEQNRANLMPSGYQGRPLLTPNNASTVARIMGQNGAPAGAAGPAAPAPSNLPAGAPGMSGAPGAAPPAGNAQTQGKPITDAILAEANAAIQKGANRATILKRLQDQGYDVGGVK